MKCPGLCQARGRDQWMQGPKHLGPILLFEAHEQRAGCEVEQQGLHWCPNCQHHKQRFSLLYHNTTPQEQIFVTSSFGSQGCEHKNVVRGLYPKLCSLAEVPLPYTFSHIPKVLQERTIHKLLGFTCQFVHAECFPALIV